MGVLLKQATGVGITSQKHVMHTEIDYGTDKGKQSFYDPFVLLNEVL